MPEFDFSSDIPDEKIIVTLGRGDDKVKVDLTFIPSENSVKLLDFRYRLNQENRDPTLDETIEMVVKICDGLVDGHEVTAEWLKKTHTIMNLSKFLDVALQIILGVDAETAGKNLPKSDASLKKQSSPSDSTTGGRETTVSNGSLSDKLPTTPKQLSSKQKKTG